MPAATEFGSDGYNALFFLKRTVTIFALKSLQILGECGNAVKAGGQQKELEYRNHFCSVVVVELKSISCVQVQRSILDSSLSASIACSPPQINSLICKKETDWSQPSETRQFRQ